jgi:acyl transferase domain-containing protein/NADPH:quinone reductase-like Zn-dependent oxidoreductase
LAVVRGSAVNQDGASNGLTAPNGPSQQRVIGQALANAGVAASEVDVVEGHGTGTRLGDPIEAQALLATYGAGRPAGRPLWLGSIKSNIGHTQAAAGVAGVIKMVMALRHGVLPASLHVDEPSPVVDWSSGGVRLLSEARQWPEVDRPRRAGVSSFGISGTNAHVILEQAEPVSDVTPARIEGPVPLLVSAQTSEALRVQMDRLAAVVTSGDVELAEVAHATATTRAPLSHRAVVVAAGVGEAVAGLSALPPVPGPVVAGLSVGFLFSGQGAQWLGMGAGLRCFGVFAEVFDRVVGLFPGWDAGAVGVEATGWAQPGLFAFEVALFRLLESWGVRPDVLVGHSVGEVAAAHVAGVLSLEDACRLVGARASLMQALPAGGAMVAVGASLAVVSGWIVGEPLVSVAAVNAVDAVVLSGDRAALVRVVQGYGRGFRVRWLGVSHGFHSVLMEPMLADFAVVCEGLSYRVPRLRLVSSVTGGDADWGDPRYWVSQVRAMVCFADAVVAADAGVWLEVGPDAVLAPLVDGAVGLQRRDRDEVRTLLAGLGQFWVRGGHVDWNSFFGPDRPSIDLPTYAFQHRRFWPARQHRPGDVAAHGLTPIGHPVLTAAVPAADGDELRFTGQLDPQTHSWLREHVVLGSTVVPGTALVDLVLTAGLEADCAELAELTLENPLVLGDGPMPVQVVVRAADDAGARPVELYAQSLDGSWQRHASGLLTSGEPNVQAAEGGPWPPAGAEALDVDDAYVRLAEVGLDYGPAFHAVRRIWRSGDDLLAEVAGGGEAYLIHPALLDAALHPAVLAGPGETAQVPFNWRGVRVHRRGATELRVRLRRTGPESMTVTATDSDGVPVLSVSRLDVRPVAGVPGRVPDDLYRVDWTPLTLPAEGIPERTVVGSDPWGIATRSGLGFAEAGENPIICCGSDRSGPDSVREVTATLLATVQEWLADERFVNLRLTVLTHRAVAAGAGDDPADLAGAAAHGLLRSAQAEHPRRLRIVDTDLSEASTAALGRAVASEEAEIALRRGHAYTRRLARAANSSALVLPADGGWRLSTTSTGTFDAMTLLPAPRPTAPVAPGRVRIAVQAAGVNFRDALAVLGLYPGEVDLGVEGAGVVLAVGEGVTALRPGDRVAGLLDGAFAPVAETDQRLLFPLPADWTFAAGAAVPIACLTAYYALVDLGGVKPGERVLVHAAAGGVGTAAVQLARHLGAEVFATASPGKWPALRAAGLSEDHIASSRDLVFADKFAGLDLVLDSLAGEFVDASLGLLGPGGRFLEMGKNDIRDPQDVARNHPGVRYRAFDTKEAGPDRIAEIFAELMTLFAQGVLRLPPITSWDVRRAPAALRALSNAELVGKAVLTMPRRLRPDGTVLITGGTGALGAHLARHLVSRHGVRGLLLLSRSGPDAPGAAGLVAELTAAGADVRLLACDVADDAALAVALEQVPADRPLTAVVHAAGLLDDGMLAALTPERLDEVLRPKVDGGWHLHRRTAHLDLDAFVLFSAAAGTLGSRGQANYSAANAYLDALAAHRQANGLPGVSLDWGPWAEGGMAAGLNDRDTRRIGRLGLIPLTVERALHLFDAALDRDDAVQCPVRIDQSALREQDRAMLPAVLHELAGRRTLPPAGGRSATPDWPARLAVLAPADQLDELLELVRNETAAVLGHSSGGEVEAQQAFKDLGLDSLTSVELRNRLGAATGLPLPAALVFDHPTPAAVAVQLLGELRTAEDPAELALSAVDGLAVMLGRVPADDPARARLTSRLQGLLGKLGGTGDKAESLAAADLESATADEVLAFIDSELDDMQ